MPKYYFPKRDDVLTHDLKSSCRYILCADKEDVKQSMAELHKYLTNIKSVYVAVLEVYREVQYLVFAKGVPKFRSDFFITLAEYIEELPDESNVVLFSEKVSDLLEKHVAEQGGGM